jgi:hypothetical protein
MRAACKHHESSMRVTCETHASSHEQHARRSRSGLPMHNVHLRTQAMQAMRPPSWVAVSNFVLLVLHSSYDRPFRPPIHIESHFHYRFCMGLDCDRLDCMFVWGHLSSSAFRPCRRPPFGSLGPFWEFKSLRAFRWY